MQLSAAFPTTLTSHEDVAIAEQLGYSRAWLYDTPQNSPDVWMMLALAATRTSTIGLGPGVLVPSLRHPMTNAAATAALADLAPGRVEVAFGTGFSGRRAMGYGGITWAYMTRYIRAFQGLLRGEIVEWEGAHMQMLHPDGHAPARPIDVPVLISALGPKGAQVARELASGLFATSLVPEFAPEFTRVAYLAWGTVLDDDEDPAGERVRLAGGPGAAMAWHGAYELGGAEGVSVLPGGAAWLETVRKTPEEHRHLAVHRGHAVHLNDADRAAWDEAGPVVMDAATLSGPAAAVRDKVDALAAAGVTELVYQPAGPDTARELERFAAAARA